MQRKKRKDSTMDEAGSGNSSAKINEAIEAINKLTIAIYMLIDAMMDDQDDNQSSTTYLDGSSR